MFFSFFYALAYLTTPPNKSFDIFSKALIISGLVEESTKRMVSWKVFEPLRIDSIIRKDFIFLFFLEYFSETLMNMFLVCQKGY